MCSLKLVKPHQLASAECGMPVKVKCSGCSKVLNAPDKARGKTLKCPSCKSPIKIPAGQKKKTPEGGGGFDDDFLADLDLSRAEDRSTKVCPRCGAEVDEMDLECAACGADLVTGEAGSGKKKKRKGPNPALFFKGAFGDAWTFTMNHKGIVIRTMVYELILISIALFCGFMTMWSSNVPPKVFWGFVTFVFAMAPIGWPWYVAQEVTKASIGGKDEVKRANFDFFVCVAFGMKFFMWSLIVGIPFLATMGLGGWMMIRGGNVIPGAVVAGLGYVLTLTVLPVSMAHFVMPVPTPGWLPNKVYPGWFKSVGACLFWFLLTLVVALPMIGCLGGAGAVGGAKLNQFFRVVRYNSDLDKMKQQAAEDDKTNAPGANREQMEIPWSNITTPAILLGVSLLFSGVPLVFSSRVMGQLGFYYKRVLDLNALEKQSTYVKKEVKYDKHGQPIDPNASSPAVKVVLVIVGILVLYIISNVIAYFAAGKLLMPESMAESLGLLD